jgi:hypothetical protein
VEIHCNAEQLAGLVLRVYCNSSFGVMLKGYPPESASIATVSTDQFSAT